VNDEKMNEYEFDQLKEGPEDYGEPAREPDPYFLQAQADLRGLYEEDRERVFFIRQVQVKFEKKYFHWITNNAILGLHQMGYLRDIRIPKEKGTSTRFFIHRSNRYAKRKINEIEKIIEEYSQDHITRSCGHRAEDLFCKAMARRGFMPVEEKVKEYRGKKWEKTGHDLDFVFVKDGIEYGAEIKNKWGYIEKEELEIKLKMCEFWGIRPLLIMRYAPKSYIRNINDCGGFALLFGAQIYDLSQEDLAGKIRDILGMPAVCPRSISEGIIDRFENWHKRQM
jgi:hypothetical protein